jgi:metal-sulfur cluster biosynthetic enzyme
MIIDDENAHVPSTGGTRSGDAPRHPAPTIAPGMPEVNQAPEEVGQPAQGEIQDPVEVKERVIDALRHVHDPELGINIVDLGLVYGVELEGDTVHVTYTLTTMGCPIGPLIEAEIRQLLTEIDGVREVNAEMVLRPPWTPEMMSEEAKAALGFF